MGLKNVILERLCYFILRYSFAFRGEVLPLGERFTYTVGIEKLEKAVYFDLYSQAKFNKPAKGIIDLER